MPLLSARADYPEPLLEEALYQYGQAHALLEKTAGKPELSYALAGRLYVTPKGWGLLSVPNAVVRGLYDALHEPGLELPPQSNGRLNAHITVFRPEEIDSIGGPDKLSDRGHSFRFNLGPLKVVEPTGWKEMSKVWFVEIKSPELEKLRKGYGLTALPKDNQHPFHLTVAVRRKRVLQENDVKKAGASACLLKTPLAILKKLLHKKAALPVTSSLDQPQETDYSCGPAALRSLLALTGVDETEKDMRAELGSTQQGGTRPVRLIQAAKEKGFQVDERHLLSLRALEQAITQGKPVICPIQPVDQAPEGCAGHYVTVVGYNPDKEEIYYHDPSTGKVRAIEQTEFLRRWHDNGSDGKDYERYGIILSYPGLTILSDGSEGLTPADWDHLSSQEKKADAEEKRRTRAEQNLALASALYHGTDQRGIESFEPRPGWPVQGEPVVFGTHNRALAISNIPKWTDKDFEQGGYHDATTGKTDWYMREMYPGAFDRIFKNAKGHLYTLPHESFGWDPRLMSEEFISRQAVKPVQVEEINDVLGELQRAGWKLHRKREMPAILKSATSAPGIPDRSEYGNLAKLSPGELVDFVTQKHLAHRAGEHEDVRIGTPQSGLFSWAARKGLPTFGQKHLGVRQPLHEHAYQNFEGEIPKGQYGGGTVKKLLQGKVLLTKVTPEEVHFTEGWSRHPQRFVLKKTNEKNWLIINTTPTQPVPHEKVHYTKVPQEQAESLLASLQPGSSVQAKIDGAASLTRLINNKPEVMSYRAAKETGHPITHSERLFHGRPEAKLPSHLKDLTLRGELYGVDAQGKAIPPQALGGLLNSGVAKSIQDQRERGIALKNMLFDVDSPALRESMPYAQRLGLVREALTHLPDSHFHGPEEANTPQEALSLFKRIMTGEHPLTQEGLVLHPPTGKPSKIKALEEQDVHVRGTFPGKGKYQDQGVGGFTYSHEADGPVAGEVGTGLSDELRREMFRDPQAFIGRVARVRSQGKFPSGALRGPALLGLHEDY